VKEDAMPNGYESDMYELGMEELEAEQFAFAEEAEFSDYMQAESPFEEVDEMELAATLLEVTDEAELEQFLGNLFRRARQAIRKGLSSPVGRALGGILKGAAKQALPMVSGALGSAIGGPAGAALSDQLTSAAGEVFGLELEGMSPEDQEFEVARQFVRFAGSAVQNAAEVPPNTPPQEAAQAAAVAAAQQHAPGLLRATGPAASSRKSGRPHSGRWIRRGRNIILINC
jgi:hypothetical protein